MKSFAQPGQQAQRCIAAMEDKENMFPEGVAHSSGPLGDMSGAVPFSKQQPTRGAVAKGRTPLSDITRLCLAQVATDFA